MYPFLWRERNRGIKGQGHGKTVKTKIHVHKNPRMEGRVSKIVLLKKLKNFYI